MRVVGRNEKVIFPELNLDLKAKVDTGAWRTALHVDGIKVIDNKLTFWIGDVSNIFEFEDYQTVTVRNSFGETQDRYSIILKLKMGDKNYKSLVSLTNRGNMKFPCLIGRRFLKRYGFIVDVRQKNLNNVVS